MKKHLCNILNSCWWNSHFDFHTFNQHAKNKFYPIYHSTCVPCRIWALSISYSRHHQCWLSEQLRNQSELEFSYRPTSIVFLFVLQRWISIEYWLGIRRYATHLLNACNVKHDTGIELTLRRLINLTVSSKHNVARLLSMMFLVFKFKL